MVKAMAEHKIDLIVPNHRNPEQREAFLASYFQRYIDLIFNRTNINIPAMPERFRAPIAEVDRDLQSGFFDRHFQITGNQIISKSDGAEMVMITAAMYREELGKDL